VQCHKEGKTKGGLRLDSYVMLVKGSKAGAVIEPGNAAKSDLVRLIELPPGDIDRMPPDGKPPITAPEITVLKWWIDQGADSSKTLKDFNLPPAIKEALETISPPGASASPRALDPQTSAIAPANPAVQPPAPQDVLKANVSALAKDFPDSLGFVSQQPAQLSFTAASFRGKLDDVAFERFTPVLPHLVSADLSGTLITDQSVARLAASQQLRQINLAQTAITDAALETLLKLTSLEEINLCGTKITGAGVLKLATLASLKNLYLSQTAVTPSDISSLREKLPNCNILPGS